MFNKLTGFLILASAPLWGRETWHLAQMNHPAMFATMLIGVLSIATGIALTSEDGKK